MGQNTKGGEQNYDLTKTKGQTIYTHTAVSVTTRNTGVYERWEMEQTQDRKNHIKTPEHLPSNQEVSPR